MILQVFLLADIWDKGRQELAEEDQKPGTNDSQRFVQERPETWRVILT